LPSSATPPDGASQTKKLEKAVNPGVAILSGFLAEVLDVWLRDPLDIFLILLNAVAVASVVGSTLMLYRIGLSEAEAPEAEERELTPEERYALRERMQRRKASSHRASGREF
jgi:hypothetical protein